MKVARHFDAWNRPQKRARRVGQGLMDWRRCRVTFRTSCLSKPGNVRTPKSGRHDGLIRSHRTLRDGSFFAPIPGNKLPGYLHSVPSGQKRPFAHYQTRPKHGSASVLAHGTDLRSKPRVPGRLMWPRGSLAPPQLRSRRFQTRKIQLRFSGNRIWRQWLLFKIETTEHVVGRTIAIS